MSEQMSNFKNMRRMFDRILVLSVLLWTTVCVGALMYHIRTTNHHMRQMARQAAIESVEKDLLYRHWAASMGGIYVPVTKHTQPNPYLSFIKERDIATPSGKKLTLVNPSYMTRQVYELAKDFSSIQGHITSLKLLRPENAPDPWEERALRAIEAGERVFGEVTAFRGAPHYRLMYPLYVEQSCLKCHAGMGYKVGDLRGGISASLPMTVFARTTSDQVLVGARNLGVIWLLGVGGIALFAVFARGRILEQEEAEEALQRNLQFTRSIIDNEPECVKLLDAEGRVQFMNPAGLAMIDADSSEDVLGRPVHRLVVPDHQEAFIRLGANVFAGGSGSLEFEAVGLKGTRRWLATHAVPLRDRDGRVESLLGITRDVTAYKLAERELQHSAARYQQLFDGNPHPMWVYDRATLAFLTVNDAALTKYGYTRGEFLAMTIADIRPAEDVPRLRETVETRREGIMTTGPWRHRKRDGTLIDVEITSHTMVWEGRDAALVLANDVTERKRAELELRTALALNQTLIDSLPYPSVLVRYPERTILAANRLAREGGASVGFQCYVGFGRNIEGQRSAEACPYCRAEEVFLQGSAVVTQEHAVLDRWLTLYWVPVDATTYLHFSIDITERKRLEQQLLQAQKIESVGRLAGGVAHDINNMLTPILGYAELLDYKLPSGDERREDLAEITNAAKRVRDMTRQLLAFARKQTLEMTSLDLNEIVSGFIRMLQMTLRESIAITVRLAPSVPPILGDKSQLEQVIMNLAVNAQDAMPAGGTFTLITQDIVADAGFAEQRPGMTPGRYVQLLVVDTGIGMDEETLQKIFDPFFTTKEAGRGTGLGLATVYGIVKQHRGYISVTSASGQGASFSIFLPAADAAAAPASGAALQGLKRGSETILVVEDKAEVLRIVRQQLETLGYRVLTAAGGSAAREVLSAEDTPADLLLTDVIMPGANGRDVYESLRQAYPTLKVLYMSGYPADVISTHGVLGRGVHFLRKPFSVRELSEKVREALDDAGWYGSGAPA